MRAAIAWRKPSKLLSAVLLLLFAVISCTSEAATSDEHSTTTSGPTLDGRDDSHSSSIALPTEDRGAAPLPPDSAADDPCADLLATATITARDPAHFWTVTELEGEISNPSSSDVHVTAVSLQFEPGVPPGIHTAELTVPLNLTLAPRSSAPWTWTGSLLVRPFHDDAPQPVVEDLAWERLSLDPAQNCDVKAD